MSWFVRLATSGFVVALVAPPVPAHAQQSNAGNKPSPDWFVSLGIDPFSSTLTDRSGGLDDGLFATLGRAWSRPGSAFGLRAQLGVGVFVGRPGGDMAGSCPGCGSSISQQFAGLTTLATREWRTGRTFRPYLFGGPSLNVVQTRSVPTACRELADCRRLEPPFAEGTTTTRWSLGGMAGVGAAFKVGGPLLVVEQAIQMTDVMRLSRATGFTPLAIGIRF